jgi:hypothetical protein
LVYFPNNKKIKSVYREKTTQLEFSLDGVRNYEEGIQIVSGRPNGTDWQKLVINAELISLESDN